MTIRERFIPYTRKEKSIRSAKPSPQAAVDQAKHDLRARLATGGIDRASYRQQMAILQTQSKQIQRERRLIK